MRDQRTRRGKQESGKGNNWYRNSARRAEKYLESVPPDKLGPAGRILVSNPRQIPRERARPSLEGIDGGISERPLSTQLPLMGSVPRDSREE